MSSKARKAQRQLGLGTAMAVLAALLCLSFASLDDAATVSSLDALSRVESVPMSCADAPASSGGGLLWCADPSAPHCIPAAPDVPRIELWSSPELVLAPSLPMPRPTYVLMSWPAPHPRVLVSRLASTRLERPPRA